MKKILLSLLTVVMVAGVVVGASGAWFTDTESSNDNTFTTGTIDISVDGDNPWSRDLPYALDDMKPSQVDYIDFVVQNVGTNPVNLYKMLDAYSFNDLLESEPECEKEGGVWNDSVTSGSKCNVTLSAEGMDKWINYDMIVELYDVDPDTSGAEPVWWENLYTDGMGHDITLDTLEGESMYLGMIPVGKWMKVYQSYHMISETGNEYQGDQLIFNITLTAEQLGVHALRLENKADVAGNSYTNWWDGVHADLSYTVKDREFAYTLDVQGMADDNYDLVAWEGYPGFSYGTGAVTVLANVTVSGNNPVISNSIELNKNLINAKVWLVPGNTTPGTSRTLPWPFTDNSLFETGLMDYYDADL